MEKENQIPVLDALGLDKIHFENIPWIAPNPNLRKIFHINKLEDYISQLTFPLPPHRKSVYDFILLTKGNSIRTKGLNSYEFNANQVFFLPAYQITTHEWMSPDTRGYFVHFDAKIFSENNLDKKLEDFSFLDYQSNPIITIPDTHLAPILNLLQRLESLYYLNDFEDYKLISFYMITIFHEFASCNVFETNNIKNSAKNLTKKYKEALSQYIYTKQKVADYAEILNVTPNHLNKCIKAETGKPAQELLKEMLILEAKSLLKYSNLNIAEIGVKLFNQSPSNFTRFFKNQTGITPKEYHN